MFLAFWLAFMDFTGKFEIILALVVALVVLFPRIYSFLFKLEFHVDLIWSVNSYLVILEFNTSALLLVFSLTDEQLLANNFSIVSVIVTTFFFFASYYFKSYRDEGIPF